MKYEFKHANGYNYILEEQDTLFGKSKVPICRFKGCQEIVKNIVKQLNYCEQISQAYES